ncbi:hypothetical protein Cadr_000030078 [Camelus dromedarius]|uniref:Uncharacterized protein n=1 Tax=Camelus dromedarius TaxID=9838 RepID=A0A5N4BZX3_CAMDR|nr:hypothetical protein Cadr_000030078 [Camelus dromedarius]
MKHSLLTPSLLNGWTGYPLGAEAWSYLKGMGAGTARGRGVDRARLGISELGQQKARRAAMAWCRPEYRAEVGGQPEPTGWDVPCPLAGEGFLTGPQRRGSTQSHQGQSGVGGFGDNSQLSNYDSQGKIKWSSQDGKGLDSRARRGPLSVSHSR